MKKTPLLFILFLFGIAPLSAQVLPHPDSSRADIRKHINYLASDALLGRNTPSPGLDSAASYLERYFRKLTLAPAGSSYRHPIGLFNQDLGSGNYLSVTQGNNTQPLELKSGFIPFGFSASGSLKTPVVFAGYGMEDTAKQYNDYEDLDVRGKIVIVLSDAPPALGQQNPSAREEAKMKLALHHGAAALVLVSGPINRLILKPRGYSWPSLSKIIPKNLLPYEIENPESRAIPAVHAGEPFIEAVWGSVATLKDVQQKLDNGISPAKLQPVATSATLSVNIVKNPLPADNIIAVLEGSDSKLKNEYLIIGAHYDHIGAGNDKGNGADYIYNGADDNASGTTGVMEIAQWFSMQPEKPRRTVVFMLFAGEERGLLGSQAYTRKPVFDLQKTVAMINLDMISRNHDTLYLEGAASCPELSAMVLKHNQQTGLTLVIDRNGLTGGSDHASFAGKGIPFLFFITGLHPDYHKVTDNPDKADAAKINKVARLAFLTAWQIANENARYTLLK